MMINLWDLFRYKIPWFLRNLWKWKSQLWYYRTWDFVYIMRLLEFALLDHADGTKSARFIGGDIVERDMKRVASGLRRLIDDDRVFDYEIFNFPRDLWPCSCEENKKYIRVWGEKSMFKGVALNRMEFLEDEEGEWKPCEHNYHHHWKKYQNLSAWVFNEIAKKHTKWWD